jgi:WD40 repeat protein
VAINLDGSLLASGSADQTIKLWSLPDGALLHTLGGHTDFVWPVAFSPDGTLLASGSTDKTIKLWSLPDGEYLMDLIDLTVSTEDFKGLQYSPKNGGIGVVTLPCGSSIPEGATCICNCVQGSVCSCVGNCSSYSSGGHYWYPN